MCMCVGLNDYIFGLDNRVLPCAYILVRGSKYSHYNFSSLMFSYVLFCDTLHLAARAAHLSHSDINQ